MRTQSHSAAAVIPNGFIAAKIVAAFLSASAFLYFSAFERYSSNRLFSQFFT